MNILGLDTALQRCSVAILRDGAVAVRIVEEMARGHAERLAPMAASALASAGLGVGDLDRVGVVVGPGGFTGVRVGLAFARGLAIGTDLGVVGVSSLAAIAANARLEERPDDLGDGRDGLVAPLIDARRGQVYAALYDAAGAARLAPFVAAPAAARDILAAAAGAQPVSLIGSGAALVPGPPPAWRLSMEGDPQIDPVVVARLAAAAPPDALRRSGSGPAPLYLRAPDAKPPKPVLLRGGGP